MVLRNQNAVMTGYDFRTGFSGKMYADSYTVMLANMRKTGSEVNKVNDNRYELAVSSNPVSVIRNNVAVGFGLEASAATLSGTAEQKANSISNRLLYEGEGVIVKLQKGSNTHFLVFALDRGSTYSANDRFIVYDPGTASSSKGNGVVFSSCASYSSYSLSDAVQLIWF